MGARRLRNIGAILVLISAATVLVALATGEVRLVTTHGVSMLPRFHTGDLAIILRAPSYHVGEIVGYYSPLLHIIVLHRIVAEHAGRFTFKGDHNSFLDPLKLPVSYVRGRLIAAVPHGGEILAWVRSPIGLGIIAFGFIVFGVGWRSHKHRVWSTRSRSPRHTRLDIVNRPRTRPVPKHAAPPQATGVGWWTRAVGFATIGLFVLIAAVVFALPGARGGIQPITYEQQIAFSYTSKVARSAVYPSGMVPSGGPIFLKLADTLDVDARYLFRLDANVGSRPPARVAVSGTIATIVDLSSSDGWSVELASIPPTRFQGSTANVELELPIARITGLARTFGNETGVALDPANVVITPTIALHGSVGHSPLNDSFAPSLAFQLTPTELSLSSSTPAAGSATDGLNPQDSGSIDEQIQVPATVSVFGHALRVTTARWLALVALATSVVLTLVGFEWLRRRRSMDESDRIRSSHGDDLVPVSSNPAEDAALVVDVATFEGLVRLAGRYDCMILDLANNGRHSYYVECGTTVYRYGVEPYGQPFGDAGHRRPGTHSYRGTALRSLS